MDEKQIEWEGDTLVYRCVEPGLVAIEAVNTLGRAVRSGTWSGRTVKAAVVEFADEAQATQNADRLAFAGLGARWSGGEVSTTARFAVRSDFGLD